MEIDELESPGTFVDFSWRSSDLEEDGLLPLEIAFALFSTAPRHEITGAIVWPATLTLRSRETQDDATD